MFPDGDIAAKMKTGRTEIQYYLSHGLAPYYEDKFYAKLSPTNTFLPKLTACSDQLFNKVTHSKQLNVNIIYFETKKKSRRVCRTCLTSHFIRHGDSKGLH